MSHQTTSIMFLIHKLINNHILMKYDSYHIIIDETVKYINNDSDLCKQQNKQLSSVSPVKYLILSSIPVKVI